MADQLIATLDFIGFVGFLISFIYSYRNFQATKQISSTWLPWTIAMAFLTLFTFSNFLGWSGIYTEFIEEIDNPLLAAAVTSILTSVLISHQEFLKPEST